jgi:hypothetical protein
VPAVDDVFVSLAQVLRAGTTPPVAAVAAAFEPPAVPVPEARPECAGLARDVRVFRARLADAFDDGCAVLLREFAYAVLGRELLLGAPGIATIATRILAEHPAAQPLRLRVAPSDVTALAPHAATLPPIVSDAELAPGDAILEFAGGQRDARLGVRFADLLENAL